MLSIKFLALQELKYWKHFTGVHAPVWHEYAKSLPGFFVLSCLACAYKPFCHDDFAHVSYCQCNSLKESCNTGVGLILRTTTAFLHQYGMFNVNKAAGVTNSESRYGLEGRGALLRGNGSIAKPVLFL